MKKSKLLIISLLLSTSISAQYGEWELEPIDSLWKQHELLIDNYSDVMFDDLVWVKYKIACYRDTVTISLGSGVSIWHEPNIIQTQSTYRRSPGDYGYRQYRLKILMDYFKSDDQYNWFDKFKSKIWKP